MASCVKFLDANSQTCEQKSGHEKWFDYIDSIFLDLIPSREVKEMAPIYRYTAGFTLVFLQIFIFVYFLCVGINTAKSTTFLTPDTYYDSTRCSQVLTSTTNTFYATRSGKWSTEIGTNFAEMIYRFDLNQYSVSSIDMYNQFSQLKNVLQDAGSIASNRTLGENVLFWTSYRAVSPDEKTTFSMTGDIKIVLNQPYHDVKIASKYGLCNASCVSAFSSTTGRFVVAYSYSEFMANDVCRAAISPTTASNMSYNSILDGDKFTIELDTQAIITALNININAPHIGITVSSDGTTNIVGLSNVGLSSTPHVYYYVDPLYPGMDYTICAAIPDSTVTPVLCGVQIGGTFAIPFLLDQGLASLGDFSPCTCNADGLGGIESKGFDDDFVSFSCNDFQFFVGVIMFNNLSSNSAPLLDYILSFANALDANRAVYSAAVYTSKYAENVNTTAIGSYEATFSFCESPEYGGCTIINMATYSGINPQNIVSDYYFRLAYGACNESFSLSISALDELVANPYGPLVESYVECIAKTSTIYSNSLGITIGNIGAYIPVICLALVTLLSVYQRFSGNKVLASYTKSERDTALDALATLLLLHRDSKFVSSKDTPDRAPPSFDIVSQLVDEIRKSIPHNPDLQQIGLSEAATQLADAARSRAHEMETALSKVKVAELNPMHLKKKVDSGSTSDDAADNLNVLRISKGTPLY